MLISRLLNRLLPNRKKRKELREASVDVSLSIARYQRLSHELKCVVAENHFSRYLVYERPHGRSDECDERSS